MADDAIGIYIVEDLMQLNTNPNTEYIIGETDVDYCIGEVFDYNCIIIIDAFLSGKQTGEITSVPLNELNSDNYDGFYSMHGIHLLNMLKRELHSIDGILIGIEPYEIGYGFTLSKPLQRCYSSILEEVCQQIAKYIKQSGG